MQHRQRPPDSTAGTALPLSGPAPADNEGTAAEAAFPLPAQEAVHTQYPRWRGSGLDCRTYFGKYVLTSRVKRLSSAKSQFKPES